MSDNVSIDLQAIENLRSLNPDDGDGFLREIVDIFVEDTPRRIAELEESLASGDVTKFARAAHSIKGSSANLGATALRSIAESLETQARKDGLGGARDAVAALKSEFSRAEADLKSLLPPK